MLGYRRISKWQVNMREIAHIVPRFLSRESTSISTLFITYESDIGIFKQTLSASEKLVFQLHAISGAKCVAHSPELGKVTTSWTIN